MSQKVESRGLWAWDLVKWIVGGSVLLFVFLFFWKGFTEAGNREAIRWSARISFLMFCLAFGASGFHQVVKNSSSFWLLMNRKYLGISFALVHFIHLFFLGILQFNFHPIFEVAEKQALLAGGVAYLFIGLMFLTSFERFADYLTKKQWKWLHTIGGYWIWGVFMSSYYKRALTEYGHWLLVALLLIVLLLRIRKGWMNRKLGWV